MVLIHTGIGLAIIVITALIAWMLRGPSDTFSELSISLTKFLQRPTEKPKEILRVIVE